MVILSQSFTTQNPCRTLGKRRKKWGLSDLKRKILYKKPCQYLGFVYGYDLNLFG